MYKNRTKSAKLGIILPVNRSNFDHIRASSRPESTRSIKRLQEIANSDFKNPETLNSSRGKCISREELNKI